MGSLIDLTGKRFGKLVVIQKVGSRIRGIKCKVKTPLWKCKCDCGNVSEVKRDHMMKGHIKSCGCLKGNPTHNMSSTRIYNIWIRMRTRCYHAKDSEYKRYGARGITVCDEWKSSFEAFRDWAMANGYRDDLTIDRIDVDGNYEPSNCRWATIYEQACNKRNNRYLTVNGETLTLSQWRRRCNINRSTMGTWLYRHGEEYAIERIKDAMCQKARRLGK